MFLISLQTVGIFIRLLCIFLVLIILPPILPFPAPYPLAYFFFHIAYVLLSSRTAFLTPVAILLA